MAKIRQPNVFKVLRGEIGVNDGVYFARIKISTAGTQLSTGPPEDLPKVPIPDAPKSKSWWSRNWHWVLVGAIVVGVLVYLYLKRRKRKNEELRLQEGERLPKINFPKPSEASGPVIELQRQTPMERYYEELEHKAALERVVEHLSKVEPPKQKGDPNTSPKQPNPEQPK